MKWHLNVKKIICTVISILVASNIYAQIDTTYIQAYSQVFSARINIFNDHTILAEKIKSDKVRLQGNNPVKLGIGASWKNKSLSFSYGFDCFAPNNKGKTESLDFKYHSYKPSYLYDIVVQRNKGFYNMKKNAAGNYDIYPDVELKQISIGGQYLFNSKKFSYKAAFNQSERQVKSAGTPQLGGGVYYSKLRTDSTVLVEEIGMRLDNFQVGINGGYAYTWVIDKYFYVTGSGRVGFQISSNDPKHFFREKVEVYPTTFFRLAAGYNSASWSVGTMYINNQVFLLYRHKHQFSINDGGFQLTVIKRLNWENVFINNLLTKIYEDWFSFL